MHLPRFQYIRCTTREEAAKRLEELGSAACLMSGGTDLLPRLKYGLGRPEVLVSLGGVEVPPPRVGGNGELRIDGLTRLAAVIRSPEVRARAPILCQAALSVASNQVRHMATLGGNLCVEARCLYYNQSHAYQYVEPCLKRGGTACYFAPKGDRCWAIFPSDTAPALLCLGALVDVVGPEGTRAFPLEDLYGGDPLYPVTLRRGEIVAEIRIPAAPPNRGQAFRKHSRRKGLEFAGLTVAAVLEREDGGRCREARIVVGSVAGAPVRPLETENRLRGQDLSRPGVLADVARSVAAEIRPVAHHGYPAGYLRRCVEVETRRALAEAVGLEPGTEGGSP
ncbi:MAG: FAD binding domain-containing protein [Deferrisomatales bacterium]|nr:FAD binding domain-containing protein [Deferrisomatales bacterium]